MDNAWGPWCALGSAATWAIGSAGYSQLSKNYTPFSINFARALIALPLFILSTFVLSGSISEGISNYQSVQASHWGWFTLSMVASYGLADTLFLWSTRSLGLPGALAVASCFPIWTALAGYFFLGEKLSGVQILGLVITILRIGIVVLNAPQIEVRPARKISVSGLLLALGTSLGWATNGFAVSRGAIGLLPPVGNTIRMLMALVLCMGFSRVFAPQSSILLPRKEVLRLGWLFVLEAFGGSCLYLYGLSHSPLALGSTLSSLAPVLSVPVALAFGLEKFSFYRTLGVCTVVFGIWCLLGTF